MSVLTTLETRPECNVRQYQVGSESDFTYLMALLTFINAKASRYQRERQQRALVGYDRSNIQLYSTVQISS